MNTSMSAIGAFRSPFTQSQWQELEHQALIFKYLMAGLPVPPELVIPIKKSFDSISMSARFFNHPTLGYCSFYGKKPDPEPGRCRRTDGKKWRCSKDAYPDSKYCERHMHRGRNRSRKHVETQTITQSSSTVTSLSAAAAAAVSGSTSVGGGGGSATSQNLPLCSIANPQGIGFGGTTNPYQLQMDPTSYGIASKECRYIQGMKQEANEHSFFSDPSKSAKAPGMDTSLESAWCLMPSRVSTSTQSKSRNYVYPEIHPTQDIVHASVTSAFSKQTKHQHNIFGGEFGLADDAKQEGQSLRPFFEEWPMTRDSWSDVEDDRSNRTSFSTTQLSISIPMASSDYFATSSRSPNDD